MQGAYQAGTGNVSIEGWLTIKGTLAITGDGRGIVMAGPHGRHWAITLVEMGPNKAKIEIVDVGSTVPDPL